MRKATEVYLKVAFVATSIIIRYHIVKVFSKMRVFTACWVSLGHGSIHCGKSYPTDVQM